MELIKNVIRLPGQTMEEYRQDSRDLRETGSVRPKQYRSQDLAAMGRLALLEWLDQFGRKYAVYPDDPDDDASVAVVEDQTIRNWLFAQQEDDELKFTWPFRLPGLKTWAGNQTLEKIWKDRVKALSLIEDGIPLLAAEVQVSGLSGLLESHAGANALDMGFSLKGNSRSYITNVGQEILVAVAFELLPVISWPDQTYSIAGPVWSHRRFRKTHRSKYYGAIIAA